jgi:hypothetical protein
MLCSVKKVAPSVALRLMVAGNLLFDIAKDSLEMLVNS